MPDTQVVCRNCNTGSGTLVRDKSLPKSQATYYHQDKLVCKWRLKLREDRARADKVVASLEVSKDGAEGLPA